MRIHRNNLPFPFAHCNFIMLGLTFCAQFARLPGCKVKRSASRNIRELTGNIYAAVNVYKDRIYCSYSQFLFTNKNRTFRYGFYAQSCASRNDPLLFGSTVPYHVTPLFALSTPCVVVGYLWTLICLWSFLVALPCYNVESEWCPETSRDIRL